MTGTYVTDGTLTVNIAPNGQRRGDGWILMPNWSTEGTWVANKRETVPAARELLANQKLHVAQIRARVIAALNASGVALSIDNGNQRAVIDALTKEFSK
jgi:hypothetical protein